MPETMRILTENFAKEFTLKCELLVKTLDEKNSERLSQCLCQCLYILKSVCLFYVLFFIHFPRVLTRKICLTIKSFFIWGFFLYSHDLNV